MVTGLKFIHLSAISIWAAGLIVLPFLLAQRANTTQGDDMERLHRVIRFVFVTAGSPAAFIGVGSGIALIFAQATFVPWFSLKLVAVGLLVVLHVVTGFLILRLFDAGGRFGPFASFGLTGTNILTVSAILWIVLAKPTIDLPDDWGAVFQPGALRDLTRQSLDETAIPTP